LTYYFVATNAQLLGLSKCISIDYLWIQSCPKCTQAAWCGLQLQSTTYGLGLFLSTTPRISDMCGVKNVKGALMWAFVVQTMNGVAGLDGAEGIASVLAVDSSGRSIALITNPILTSVIALANTEYPAGTLRIETNPILECVPLTWRATDKDGRTIPHGSCPTTSAPTPAPGSIGSTGGDMLIVIAVLAALACAAGFVYYRRRASAAHKKDDSLQKSLLDGDELEMVSLCPNVPHTSQTDIPHTYQTDIPHTSQTYIPHRSQTDIPHTSPPLDMDPNALNPVGSPEFDPDEGFPINDSAKALCVRQLAARRDTSKSNGEQFKPTGDGGAQHTTKVQYADLQAATYNFGDIHKIGDGGSCVLYKIELHGLPCAIKLLSQDASTWEERQFTAEIDVLTRVKHENTCQLYARSTDGPSRCLVLELINGHLAGGQNA
jgi:hypothetical protein